MTTAHDNTMDAAPVVGRRLFNTRIGSLLAFLPLGVWTTWHLWENLSAWLGPEAWESRVTAPRAPIAEVLVSTVVLLPLVLHTIWGIRRLFIMKANVGRYPFFDNVKFVLQRLSALGLLLFLPAHIWLARIRPMIEHGRHESFADLSYQMHHHTPTLVVYLLGVLGTAYHLANGLATGGLTWGYTVTTRTMRRMNVLSVLFFVVLLGMGYGAIYALWEHGGHPRAEIRGPIPSAAPAEMP